MIQYVIGVAVLVGSGLVAGVLFCVALSVVPTLMALPPQKYVHMHKLLGRNFDPVMPILVLTTVVLNSVLAFLADDLLIFFIFVLSALCMFGVSVVSHLCNVPINRQIKSMEPSAPTESWEDVRPRWKTWHLLRTFLSITALVATATAVVIP